MRVLSHVVKLKIACVLGSGGDGRQQSILLAYTMDTFHLSWSAGRRPGQISTPWNVIMLSETWLSSPSTIATIRHALRDLLVRLTALLN